MLSLWDKKAHVMRKDIARIQSLPDRLLGKGENEESKSFYIW